MITSYLTMQNAILARNMATTRMMQTSNAMSSTLSFGNSQPLHPSFSKSTSDELQMKSDETKISVFQKIIDAITKKLGKDIKKSTPKYAGLDCKA